jgi:hypothetical protein
MSKLEIPISTKVLWHTGDRCFWVDIDLHVKDRAGHWHQRAFRVDTATDLTTMAAYEAKRLGLPIPAHPVAGAVHKQTGLAIHSGFLRFRIAGLNTTEYAVSCFFLGDPDTPPNPNQPVTYPRQLLQPLQLLDQLRFTMDKDPTSAAIYGTLTVEQKSPNCARHRLHQDSLKLNRPWSIFNL